MTETYQHTSVLRERAVELLNIQPHGIYIDATLGRGGHTTEILKHLAPDGQVIAFDQDDEAITYVTKHFQDDIESGRLILEHRNFREMDVALQSHGIKQVNGILYDLGVSSPQLDDIARGFTYRYEAPLDMRMNREQELTAETIVNEWPFEDLVRIFKRYGEEPFAKQIARAIEHARADHRIQTTNELVDLVKQGIPAAKRRTGGHPAKRVFQAVRIAVNDELGAIETSLEQALQLTTVGGHIVVISFQSLEDRLVKTIFREATTPPEVPANVPLLPSQLPKPDFQLLTRKPIVPDDEEIKHNQRSHSAKCRAVERVSQ
ncbi:MAG: 16S rRNA (cytosine(1402)-N(4))-methyltransferase RsmH [Aerococcus sp.]|nr:16S rRNA (cytosine(1402)-N(4))-methyltransferase RsmH [Aerococcus sp.]